MDDWTMLSNIRLKLSIFRNIYYSISQSSLVALGPTEFGSLLLLQLCRLKWDLQSDEAFAVYPKLVLGDRLRLCIYGKSYNNRLKHIDCQYPKELICYLWGAQAIPFTHAL